MPKSFLFIIFLMIIGCKNQNVTQADALYDEVMVIHDKVMPETATIQKYIADLKSYKSANDSSNVVLKQIKALDDADEAMMDWMAKFVVPENGEEKITYLQAEKEEITLVSDQMNQALANAKTILDSLKQIKEK